MNNWIIELKIKEAKNKKKLEDVQFFLVPWYL